MTKLTKESNQLNLTVVALVALVAIVGLVALVLNAASLASISEDVATGMRFAQAEETEEFPDEEAIPFPVPPEAVPAVPAG